MLMIRKAQALWSGSGALGVGNLTTDSGTLSQTPYSYRTRFEYEKGTNPEELIAAAHAACFSMSLAFQLDAAGHTANEIHTQAAVSLDHDGNGFRITRSALTVRAEIPGIDQAAFAAFVQLAEKNCPVSQALRAEVTLEATLM
jgi:osmotically inducible protein OsmC